ncbi:hypothetical protein SK128_023105, partial [Halocaridina rubra]
MTYPGPSRPMRAQLSLVISEEKTHVPLKAVLSAPATLVSTKVEGPGGSRERRMDRLRRSFRESFRKKKDHHHHVTEASKPHQWQTDEASVRAGTCSFPVK